MNKTISIAKKYQDLFPDKNVTVKGAWITIDDKAFRSKEVKQMIDEVEVKSEPIEGDVTFELIQQIYKKADVIRHSSIKVEMTKNGHDIAKLAKRLLNIMGV